MTFPDRSGIAQEWQAYLEIATELANELREDSFELAQFWRDLYNNNRCKSITEAGKEPTAEQRI